MKQSGLGRTSILLWLSIYITLGCSEVYNPDIEVGDNIMYVEGKITDTPGEHTIQLRYTAAYTEKAKFSPVTGALISIIENNSIEYRCLEKSDGVYATDSTFSGTRGNTYVLRVESTDGNIFESAPQVLPEENTPVNSVYGLKETRAVDYYNNYGEYILKYKNVNQVYANMTSASENTYYRFETQATLEDAARLKVQNGSEIDLVPLYQWISYMSENLSVIEVNNQVNEINKIPLTFLDIDSEEFSEVKYQFEDEIVEEYATKITDIVQVEVETDTGIVMVDSIIYGLSAEIDDFDLFYGWILQIYQYSISKDAYIFWSDVKKLEEISGEIFDPIATQLRGNMHCLTDESIEMLGLFEVASQVVTPAFVNFNASGEIFLSKMLEGKLNMPPRGWQDSIPPPFWIDKIQN